MIDIFKDFFLYACDECVSSYADCEIKEDCWATEMYKQLQQIKVENEKLKTERDFLLNQLIVLDGEDVTVQLTQEQFEEYQQLKSENERMWKQGSENYVAIKQAKTIYELQEENEKLKAENYQLQKSCQICENFIDGIPCKPLRDMDYDLQMVINQRDKFIKTLEEIKEIVEKDCGNCEYSQNCERIYQDCEEEKIDKIQQKISEVINE